MIRRAIRACTALALGAALLGAAEPVAVRGVFRWTVVPPGGDGAPRPPRNGRFLVQPPASYDVVVRDGDDGPVDRWCSDGERRWEVSRLGPDEPADVRGPLSAGEGDEDPRLVLACLRLDLEVLGRRYAIARPVPGLVELRPREGDGAAVRLIRIRTGAGGDPDRVETDLSDGSRWLIELTAIERSAPVEPSAFRPAP